MKKTVLAVCAIILMLAASVFAHAEKEYVPDEMMFTCAKESVSLISYGEYDMALKHLMLDKVYDGAALKKFIDLTCKEIYMGSVQTEVSVAWPEEAIWKIAVPFEAPEDEAVGALVFVITDGAFTEIQFLRWGDVVLAYEYAEQAIWNLAYTPDYVIVTDW
ncbi:MAG: hypothetical protein IKJ65_08255 [Clostridia bacterium]|nr:hypothetical protein [Clostridia bacterium]